jgi:hypothetical protein
MPYLHWEYSIARHHTMRIIQDARKTADQAEALDQIKLQAAEIHSLPCSIDVKLLRYQLPENGWLHMRRTLDHSYYPSLEQTDLRDQDQVVERYSRRQKEKRAKRPPVERNAKSWEEPRVIMVDQLWL